MRKGFLHVVEIVIVALMAFLVILQFSYVPKQNTDWAGMKLSTQANDILFSLNKKGVDWFNSTEVDKAISSFISNNTIYSLKIRNVMKPSIKVGCICSAAEATSLANALRPFDINSQPVSFSVTQISPIAFSHEYDVIVINDSGLSSYYNQIRQFLAADKGIVQFRSLDQSEIDSVQTDLFGLKWNNSLGNPDTAPVEFRSNMSSEPYYNIYKYFHNIPVFQDNFTNANAWSAQTGTWNINSGNYVGSDVSEAITITSLSFQDRYSMRAWIYPESNHPKLIIYWQDSNDYVSVDFDVAADTITVFENASGVVWNRGSGSYLLNLNRWYDAKIIPKADGSLKIYVNNSYVFTSQPVTIPASTRIGLSAEAGQSRFDNVRVTFAETHNFSSNLLQNEKVEPADNNSQKIILLQKSRQLPACIVNSNIADERGRTAWLAYADPSASQEISTMLKTLVVWAAGDENEVVKNEVRNIPVVTSLYRTYDQDMYQPVEIVLTMGNLYG